jgi:hypothetical protein
MNEMKFVLSIEVVSEMTCYMLQNSSYFSCTWFNTLKNAENKQITKTHQQVTSQQCQVLCT